MVSLFGKDLTFYTLLEEQADAAVAIAKVFQALCADLGQAAQYAAQAEKIENDADGVGRQLMSKVDSTFVTPMDKEDLHALSTAIEDITDNIEAAIARVHLYKLSPINAGLPTLVELLVNATEAIRDAVGNLRALHSRDTIQATLDRIHHIINDSDKQFRQALANLFNMPNPDPILVQKWSQVYDRVEGAVDKCEIAADLIGSVVIKYA